MPKHVLGLNQDFALEALNAAAPKFSTGTFIEVVDEGDFTETYLFESKQKGYVGWRWAVVVFAPKGQEPTVSEVLLVPGPDSLVAPDWVPWSERLADYKALQAELEAQAALDADEADEAEEIDDADESDASNAAEEASHVGEVPAEPDADNKATEAEVGDQDVEELAAANLEEGENSKGKPEKTRRKPPRFLRRRKRGAKNDTED